ncbi:hypothetical protein [Novosphingobium sp. CF614]|nr:hypothetical protein [Novosphingobium sp. CF614]
MTLHRRLKRAIYQLPVMAPYRARRTDRLSRRFRGARRLLPRELGTT